MLAAHLTPALVLFGVGNHCLHTVSALWQPASQCSCLASSQSLCLALSQPDSLQGSPYCEGLAEERGGPQPNEDASLLPAFLTTAGGGGGRGGGLQCPRAPRGVCRDVFWKTTGCRGSFKLGSVSFLASGIVLAWSLWLKLISGTGSDGLFRGVIGPDLINQGENEW